MEFDLTEFEQEVIRDWRVLRPQEVLILTKSRENSTIDGIIETRRKRSIAKKLDKISWENI